MPAQALVSHHLDLYEYWLAKRGSRRLPTRSDIDPADIPALLMLVDKTGDDYRYRLLGSALAKQLGKDVTGWVVGSQFANPSQAIAAKRLIYERVFTTASPVLAAVEFKISPGTVYNILQLILPLSNDGSQVNMAISSLVARFNFDIRERIDLKCLPVEVQTVADIERAADLKDFCLQWEQSRIIRLPQDREAR